MEIEDYLEIYNKTNADRPCEVSIWCITYNHKDYIETAMDGFLNQKTTFDFQIMVYDDASTDGTIDILKSYAERFPGKVGLVVSKKNTYQQPELRSMLDLWVQRNLMNGKYVALCDGDDYWIDENKLQIQWEFMNEHPKCAMTCHASIWIDYSKGETKEFHPYEKDGYLSTEDIVIKKGGNVSTASLFLRRDCFIIPEDFPKADVGDIRFQFFAMSKGDIYYFNRPMSAYRSCVPGSWSVKYNGDLSFYTRHLCTIVIFYLLFDQYTEGRFHEIVHKRAIAKMTELKKNRRSCQWNEFEEICRSVNTYGFDISFIINIQKKILEFEECRYKFSEEEKSKIEEYDHVVVYGTGKYSKVISNCLIQNRISFDGFMVSEGHMSDVLETEYPIWDTANYPYEFGETFVVVGIDDLYRSQLEDYFGNIGIEHYFAPLWVEF